MTTTSSPEDGFSIATNADSAPERNAAYPLSPLQRGMLFQWQLDQHSGTDVEQILGDLHEPIDPELLEKAWQGAVSSFSTLRTSFTWDGLESPLQKVETAARLPFTLEDLRAVSSDDAELRVSEFLDSDRRKGFNLAQAPAMRVHLFQLADAHFRMVWSVHHIVIDGRSFEVVLNSVFDAYDGAPSTVLDRPYAEYIEWIERQDFAESRAFWRQKLAGFSAPTPIPTDLSPGSGPDQYQHRWTHLSLRATQQLRELASRENLTLNTLVMSAWGLMLSRYSGEQDIAFGATKTTRRGTIADADSIAGVFLATIPVRLKVDPEMSVLQWLQRVREEWVSLRGFEHLPLVEIRQVSEVRTPRLFDTLFVFENYQFGTRLSAQGGRWASRHFEIREQPGFPLTIAGYGDAELALRIEFDAQKFSSSMIGCMAAHLTTLLESWASDASGPLWAADMLTDTERHAVVHEWNETATEYPRHMGINELFAEQAAQRSHAIAVECDGSSLSYGALEARASALATRLVREGVRPGDCVGLFAERSLNFVVGCLAILKAGAAYLPLEPGYPNDRLAYMVVDASASVVLASRNRSAQIADGLKNSAATARILEFDAADPFEQSVPTVSLDGGSASEVNAGDTHARVAYIMYTSGSSGQPKGVAVTHRGVVRLVRNAAYMQFSAEDVMLGMATTMFDASTWEIWTALLNGGRLVLSPPAPLDLVKLADLVEQAGITALLQPVALFQQVVDFGLHQYRNVKLIAVGGDVAPVFHLRRALDELPGCRLVNAYGPTENAVITCAYVLAADRGVEEPLPIGPPISNTRAYVLDSYGAPAAIGVSGELYCGGDGVALGYVNRPELTADRFLPDPFSSESGARMYRSGDAARWRADGVIEFLGRLDNQVKIRGYRVEPGEIEAAMSGLPGVRMAAIAVRLDGTAQKRLIGYYVVEPGQTITSSDIRTALRARLPDYMIPAAIMSLPELPLTNSGKIDRKSLPDPLTGGEDADTEASWRGRPLGRSQRQLAMIWKELLGRESIGIDDDFFEIGGHSLLAVRMMGEVERVLGRRLALAALLERPTIRELAKRIDLSMLAESEPSVVVLQAGGTARPFAFVHGDLTGGGWYCRRLAALIGQDVPMIVLPTFRPPESGESRSIETMAAMHLREVRKVQPEGPYRLGGFCAGGLIALEMARELERTGETVERLVLVDSVNEQAPLSRWRPFIDRLAPAPLANDQFARRLSVLRRFKYYDSRLRTVRAMGAVQLARWAMNAVRIRLPGRKASGRTVADSPSRSPKAANSPTVPPERKNLMFYSRSASVYVPRGYAGTVDLVFSSDPTDQSTNATDPRAAAEALRVGYANVEAGWRRVLPGARVHHIPGTHIGLIVDNIDKLGACLRGCLGVTDE